MIHDIIVAITNSPTVQGRYLTTISLAGVGNARKDGPKSKVKNLRR
jgi:hypothetical protein